MSHPSAIRIADESRTLDITLEEGDEVQFEVQERSDHEVLYVHVNGITVLRICRAWADNDILKMPLRSYSLFWKGVKI